MTTNYTREIADVSTKYGLDPALVTAQVLVESGGKTDAFRYEASIAKRIQSGQLKPSRWPANPALRRVAASYGLLQILFVTACDHGFPGEPEMLFVPAIGLEYGAAHLAWLLKWASGDYRRAFAAFNGGKSGNVHLPYRNAAYADKVLAMEQTR